MADERRGQTQSTREALQKSALLRMIRIDRHAGCEVELRGLLLSVRERGNLGRGRRVLQRVENEGLVLRVEAGKHFWTDVIAGSIAGSSIGVLVPTLHRSDLGKRLSFALRPSPRGAVFNLTGRF